MATILVIDDDGQVRAFLRLILEKAGHQILEAAEGAEGISTYLRHAPSLVFCDLFLPGKEGLETIRELRRQTGVGIVAMSGGSFQRIVDCLPLARQLGATKILHKPFTREALAAVLRDLLPATGAPEETCAAASVPHPSES